VHRPLDGHHRVREEDEFIFEQAPMPDDPEEFDEEYDEDFDGEDLQQINPDTWGEEYE
jgi:hypothetical protein